LLLLQDRHWKGFYFDGLHWRSPGSLKVQDDEEIAGGEAVLIRRAARSR
jgi:hypothetical protein